jgi:hypothetical protein
MISERDRDLIRNWLAAAFKQPVLRVACSSRAIKNGRESVLLIPAEKDTSVKGSK